MILNVKIQKVFFQSFPYGIPPTYWFLLLLNKLPQFSGLKNPTDLLSHSCGGQKSALGVPGLKSRCHQSCFPSGSAVEAFIPLLFLASKGCPHCLMTSSNQQQQWSGVFKSLSHCITLTSSSVSLAHL